MSLFHALDASCPHCGGAVSVEANFSVNADRRPDYRSAIVDGSFQTQPCAACGEPFRLEPEMTYLDVGRGLWVLVKPARELDQWADLERMADVIFEANFGPAASAPAREVGASLTARVTFGWPALREKIVANELGIDDTALELLKLALLRGDSAPPLSDAVELRLMDRVGETLRLAWIHSGTGEMVEGLEVPAAALDAYQPAPPAWEPLTRDLEAGAFRDLHRLMVAPA